jgi:putative sterol carrier protein
MPSDRAAPQRNKKDATSAFFAGLAERGHEPLLATTTGTLRFDLVSGRRVEHWFVSVKKGDVAVSNKESRADATVRIDRAFFDRMVTGRANAMAATLRGVVVPEGDLGLVISFQRLFPGPPASRRSPARAAAKAGGKR